MEIISSDFTLKQQLLQKAKRRTAGTHNYNAIVNGSLPFGARLHIRVVQSTWLRIVRQHFLRWHLIGIQFRDLIGHATPRLNRNHLHEHRVDDVVAVVLHRSWTI